MTRFIAFILLVSMTSLTSCDSLLSDYDTKDLFIEVKDYKPLLCVFANYMHEKGLSLELSSTLALCMHQRGPEITSAKVTLAGQDGRLLFDDTVEFTITSNDYHKYKTNFIDINRLKGQPMVNEVLMLSVEVQGFEKVTGQTTIPALVNATQLTVNKYVAEAVMYRFILQFDDPKEAENYYLVSSVYYLTSIRIPAVTKNDTVSGINRHQIPISDPVFDFMPNIKSSTKEPFDISTHKPRIFSDKGFNGNGYGLKVEVPLDYTSPTDASTHRYNSEYAVELYSISKDLFEGYKSNYMAKVIEGDIYAEPVIIYSNMSNKVGLFGAINGPSSQIATVEQGDRLAFDRNGI